MQKRWTMGRGIRENSQHIEAIEQEIEEKFMRNYKISGA
jgi:hypothetical protein